MYLFSFLILDCECLFHRKYSVRYTILMLLCSLVTLYVTCCVTVTATCYHSGHVSPSYDNPTWSSIKWFSWTSKMIVILLKQSSCMALNSVGSCGILPAFETSLLCDIDWSFIGIWIESVFDAKCQTWFFQMTVDCLFKFMTFSVMTWA